MRIWKTGDAVRVTCKGRTVVGTIALASPNGKSLALQFDALAGDDGIWLNGTALFWDDETRKFRDLRTGVVMELSD
jgi:hypothetical protein